MRRVITKQSRTERQPDKGDGGRWIASPDPEEFYYLPGDGEDRERHVAHPDGDKTPDTEQACEEEDRS